MKFEDWFKDREKESSPVELLKELCRWAYDKGYDRACLDTAQANNALHSDRVHPATSEDKSAKQIQKEYAAYLRAHRGR